MKHKLITKRELSELYDDRGTAGAAEFLGCSKPTLYKLLRQAGILLHSPRDAAFKPDYRIKLIEE